MSVRPTIVLCCIKPYPGREGFSAGEFLSIASGLGKVAKIIIFSRKTIVKLFVEFWESSPSQREVDLLSSTECEFGKIQAFLSDKPGVRCEQTDPNDFWFNPEAPLDPKANLSCTVRMARAGPAFALPGEEPGRGAEMTLDRGTLSHQPAQGAGATSLFNKPAPVSPSHGTFQQRRDDVAGSGLTAATGTSSRHLGLEGPREPDILLIRGFDHKSFEAHNFAALVSTWGAASEVFISKKHHLAFVTFEGRGREAAHAVHEQLNGVRLFNSPLRIDIVDDIHPKFIPNSSKPDAPRLIWRRAQNATASDAPPDPRTFASRFLLVSNASEYLQEGSLITLLEEVGRAKDVLAVRKTGKNGYFVAFRSINDAVRALALLQGLLVDNRKLRLQFTEGPRGGRPRGPAGLVQTF